MRIGIDIVKNSRMQLDPFFYQRFLHPVEINFLKKIKSQKRIICFLAGRWAAKEAVFKAVGWKHLLFTDIIIMSDQIDEPKVVFDVEKINHMMVRTKWCPFDFALKTIDLKISISHETDYSVACAIISHEQKRY